ncbi:ATP-dependent Clp protease ATP-binding subunit CLPT2, chloroplastic-like isoform X2 [Amaranthus tricolor]|uniref:ATP-dependent Clp protease ATP-binding subunit CLPT2, chloroplastic-like isoform X2 n=1 Tax=Amaranthus tricolor TaxID=29722 RepID=UPI002590848F|nr:ATP-dependent Clp protease ATP-binding subunit CLPT2, chloroplastic-like isoform X2 [Amaranthus tricolor]
MAANAHSLSRTHLQFPTFYSEFRRPKNITNCISFPFSSFSSLTSQNSILATFSPFLLYPSSKLTHLSSFSTKSLPVSAIVAFSLPTASPERVSGDKVPKWSWRAIKSFAMGELEARKLKYPTTGTEALLMGILIEGTGVASRFLRENGITLTKVREESIRLLGKGDLYFFSPEHPPLTDSAQKALDWALDQKLRSGVNGEIMTIDILLGIWSEEESAGHKILAALGFDDEKAEKLKSLGSKPNYDER